MRRFLFILTLIASLATDARSQPGMTFHFDSSDGLPSNTVYAITQDSDGILWVGTRRGLCRFDGIEFKTVIPDKRITSLAVDRENRIWAGTTEGLEVIAGPDWQSPGPKGNIRALLTDSDGYVWATVGDTLLLKLSYRDGIIEHARCFYDKRDSEGDYPYYQIYEAQDGKLWPAGRIVRFQYIEDREHPQIIHPFGNGGFCSGSYAETGGELYAFDDHTSLLYTYEDGKVILRGKLPIAHARLLTTHDGRLWAAGTYGVGAVNLEKPAETPVFKTPSTELYCIFEDRSNNIWVGGDNGLSAISTALKNIQTISTDNVTALLEDSRGKLWIGRAEDRVSSLYEDSKGVVYVGLWNNTGWEVWKNGRMRKDRLTGPTPPPQHPAAESLSGANWISDFLEDSRGRFWVVTWEGVGLNEWDRERHRSLPPHWLSPFRYPTPQVDSNIYVSSRLGSRIIEDSHGNLVYATTEAGLNIIDAETGLVTKYYKGNSAIPDDYVTDLCLAPDGTVWAATRSGLWSPTGAHYLDGKLVQSVEADANGRLWAGTEEGLYFIGTDGSIGVARKALGFPSDIYGEHVSCRLANGCLAFGGPEGAAVFHPDSLLSLSASGNMLLESLVQHRYRLNGGPWTEGRFNGFPDNTLPGRYTLEEQRSDIFGRWDQGESAVSVILVPLPLWLRWPFLLLYALALAALVWTIIRLRERRLLEKEVDMRNQLFSIISHDLRNPVAGNRLLSHQLLQQVDQLSPEQIKEALEELAGSADTTSALLENLLLWSLNQKGMLKPVMREENLRSLSEEAAKSILHGDCIEIIVPSNLTVRTDRNMLLTCLRNLLDNAVKVTPKGGKVVLNAQGTQIRITDQGPGMKADTEWGHGLGLVLTRELLEKMGASLSSLNLLGEGLEITIQL